MLKLLCTVAGTAVGIALPTGVSAADPFTLRSTVNRTALIELFTSEGCSSCPPAERWVNSLTNNSGLWRDFVPVVFHVDYWDGLGWPDRFASGRNTLRQHGYAASWKSESVYTPAFVLSGTEWRSLLGNRSTPKVGTEVGVLELKQSSTNHFSVRFTPAANLKGPFEATVAWIGGNLLTRVQRGENAGRALEHNFVALDWATLPLRGDAVAEGNVQIRQPMGADARKLGLAVWVTRSGSPVPLQAAGGWMP